MTNALFGLEGINAWYGTAQALFDVSLDVKSGEMIGLLGRNGAGKSTTFKSILGIEARRTGISRLEGVDLSRKSPEAIARAGVAWVPPDRRIFPDLTVRENLQLAARSRRVPLDINQITDALPLLLPLLDRRGDQLSGGEQQAVAVARALAGQPKVLLLDEPTEGLAPLVVHQLGAAIAELPKKFDVAVILAEQNLQFVLRLVKRVFVLETGRIVYHGSSEEFDASPELQHRYLSVSAAEK